MEDCPTCKPPEGSVNHVPGHVFVGWGCGWQPCPRCGGSGKLSGAPANRKEALAQIIETGLTITAMVALAKAFQLDEREAADADRVLQRMDEHWAEEVESYLRAWGRL